MSLPHQQRCHSRLSGAMSGLSGSGSMSSIGLKAGVAVASVGGPTGFLA